jgi:hypothetical protein
MSSPYDRGAAAPRTAVQTVVLIVACLIAGVLGIVAVRLMFTGGQSPPATAPLMMPSSHRVAPAVCGGYGGSLTIDPPSMPRDFSIDWNPS